MNENDCIADLGRFEQARRQWLISNQGSLHGFTTDHGKLLIEQAGGSESLKAHALVPPQINAVTITDVNRDSLAAYINAAKNAPKQLNDSDVVEARAYVEALYGVSFAEVQVIPATHMVMQPTSLGAVYCCGTDQHVLVVPENSFDPMGVLVRQFGIAAHYTIMRRKRGLAAMVSNDLAQAMTSQYAMLAYASEHPDRCSVMSQMQLLVSWEFAKGLSKTPEMPMGFIVSDLGEALMKAYGPGMFKAIVMEQYDSMSNGQGIWFGTNSFTGTVLAMAYTGSNTSMRRFMAIDTGDRSMGHKLAEAFGHSADFDWVGAKFNDALASIIHEATSIAA
jgi:hypothetical protein